MNSWKIALRDGAIAGSLASVMSTIVLAVAGSRQAGSAVAPTNAVSHWLWGSESLQEQRPTLRHTLVGYVTHHLSSIFWAVLCSRLYGQGDDAKRFSRAVAGGLATSAAAYAVDYTIVPERLRPGFEHRVSPAAVLCTFGALAAGLALGAVWVRQRDRVPTGRFLEDLKQRRAPRPGLRSATQGRGRPR